jgi:hypothetical protein
MKKLTSILATTLLTACSTAPIIVPDTTKDNVVMQKLKWEITNHNSIPTNWGWVLWYLPIVDAAMIWMWRKYIKQCPECGKTENTTTESKTLNG